MDLMKIIDKANELTINNFNIGIKIAYSFVVVDSLLLIVGFMVIMVRVSAVILIPDRQLSFVFYSLYSHPFSCVSG